LWLTGPAQSGQTRIVFFTNGLGVRYRVGESCGLVGLSIGSSGSWRWRDH
jgi:hypothetical protein